MADAAVESLLENLHLLQLHRANLISGAVDQIHKLEANLRLFREFLNDSTEERRRQDDSLQGLVHEIRGVVYEAQDIVNATVTQAADSNSKHYFLRAFVTPEMLLSISGQVESICRKIRDIDGGKTRVDFASLGVRGEGHETSEGQVARQVRVIGIEDETRKVTEYLTEKTEQLDVLTVVGVAGLGKTTLAWKVFSDATIKYEFPTRIWVYVSQQFSKKDIFLCILREFMRLTEDMYEKSDEELASLVTGHLDTRRFLIVMDDVWKPEDWAKLEIALPRSNRLGKVLITSRFKEVAEFANPERDPHQLRFLDPDESWLLFRTKVFNEFDCPPELEGVGVRMARRCHGLPLAILVVGGMLGRKFYEASAREKTWKEMSDKLSSYDSQSPLKFLEQTISLSYDTLPYHLRECFLYLGIFPEDYEIPVWKLIHMWSAEGFIQEKAGITMEETAENRLDDLIVRNLVRVDKMSASGRVKSCRVHDTIRDFCKIEAGYGKENLLEEITKSVDGVFSPQCRRLSVHSDADTLDFLSSKPYGPRVRSFVCFSREEINLPPQNISVIPRAFKLIGVLEAKPIKFAKVPKSLYQLIHLKYIALSVILSIIPAAFSKLWNLQTLIVDTTSYTLEVRADIWSMTQLRHFITNASATLPDSQSREGEKLQTLSTISPESCTPEVFNKARNLKKLGVRGQLIKLLDGKNWSFDNLGKLVNLEKLKLLNGVFYSIAKGRLPSLPPCHKFPPNLRSVTLSNTFLDWSHMHTLGLLENLEAIKLKDNAFVGKEWKVADGGFRRLQVLHIGSTNLEVWVASGRHFPRLRQLRLQNCEELEEIPIAFADIATLQLLDLYRTTMAAGSAEKIQKAKEEQVSSFQLCIFPPPQLRGIKTFHKQH